MKTYPLSQSQYGIFIEWEQDHSMMQYNLPCLFHFSKQIHTNQWRSAIKEIIKTSPIYYNRLVWEKDEIRQYPDLNTQISIEHIVLEEQEVVEYINHFNQPFDLYKGNLCRFAIIETPQNTNLFAVFHHIIFDGLSVVRFMQDIERAYQGETLTAESYTLYDAAEEEVKIIGTESYLQAAAYYKEKFQKHTFSQLSTNTATIKGKIRRVSSFIPIKEVELYSKEWAAAPNLLFMAAYSFVLSIFCREKQVMFSTVNHGRIDKRLRTSYGMYVKSVPIIAQIDKEKTIDEFVKSFKRELIGSIRHGVYPFSHFCRDLSLKPELSFGFQGESIREEIILDGEKFMFEQCTKGDTAENISVVIYQQENDYEIRLQCSDAMYPEQITQQIVDSIAHCVHAMMSNPNQLVGQLSILSAEEQTHLLSLSQGETLSYNKEETFVDMVCREAKCHPETVAVVDGAGFITYRELDGLSDRLARKLQLAGIGEGEFVGIMLPRQKEFVISLLATMKAGAAYIPLDSEYPVNRLLYMLEDSKAKILITTGELIAEKSKEGRFEVENIIFADMSGEADAPSCNVSKPEGLAYMIYTSGSTGNPKGVMVQHKALRSFIAWRMHDLDINHDSRCCQHASFSFDASLDDLLTPLAAGGQVHILASDLRQNLYGIDQYIKRHKISGMTLSTQMGMELLNRCAPPLKFLMMGGEKLQPTRPTDITVINGYGPTEFTVCSSYHIVREGETNIPIGRPVPNSASYIVDMEGRLLPQGVVGELCLCGDQMAKGYWEQPQLTAEKFVDCSFLPGKRMYRTGDLARWNEQEELEYCGRIDNQIKLRGYRIELGEIERVICDFEGITTAIVDVKEIASTDHLCGYYTSTETIDEEKLRGYLSETLTDYMVPTAFMRLDSLPLTPNGKANRTALPIPEIKADEIVAPASELEQSLFDLVSKMLDTASFGVTSNLISIGLTSMGAIKLSLAVLRELNLNLPTKAILQKPIIRDWIELIGPREEELSVYARQDYYPLTENQLGIYIDWEQHRDSLQYNVPMALELTGVSAGLLKESLLKVLESHPYLKTRLEIKEGEIVQKRIDDASVDIVVETLESDPDADFFQSLLRPFSQPEGKLYRMEIYESPGHTYLLMDIHHIIYDGGSVSILMNDLQKCYNGIKIVPEQFTAYDYSLYYRDWKTSEEYLDSECYFDRLVEGAESVLYPVSSEKEADNGSQELRLSLPCGSVKELCRKVSVTENCFFTTAFMQVLHRITREDDILITTISNGRSSAKMARSIGMFVQTLPVVSHTSHQTVSESLIDMQKQLLETISRDKYPFTRLVERHGVKPNIMIVYQGEVLEGSFNIGEKKPTSLHLHLTTSKMPLSVMIVPNGEEYNLLFEYDGSLYSRLDMERLSEALNSFIASVTVAHLDEKIETIPMVNHIEKENLIALGKGEELVYDRKETFIDLFQAQVSLYPDSTAVVDEVSSITYAELDKQSDLLARMLIKSEVDRDKFVAVMLPRRKEFLVSVLAVFKSGGAYIPLDSDYPNDRLLYMLEDSGAKALITTRTLFEEKRKEGDFKAENILFIDEFDFSGHCIPINNSHPESLAYMIYTSGSTGKPKGVMIQHKALRSFLAWLVACLDIDSTSRCGQHLSFSFDASLNDLFTPLAAGGQVHILDSDLRRDLEGMNRYIEQHHITGIALSTQLGMELLNRYTPPLRFLMMGGEKLQPMRASEIRIINAYGPTEFTVCSSYHVVNAGETNIPIGRPVPNTISAIVDLGGNLVPRGMEGEICLIGRQIARGYWNRPELTAEKFVHCPFIEGERMYRTGDIGRWNENGELEYLGRIDNQVKLRGFRIELGEIESVICRFEGIQSAVVLVKGEGTVQRLIAYFTADTLIDIASLRSELSLRLTDYMVPHMLIQIEAFPLTPNGKVDRKVLLQREDSNANISDYIPPSSASEILLTDIISSTIGMDKISVEADLIDLGLTSIQIMLIAFEAQTHGIDISVSSFYQNRSIRNILKEKQSSLFFWGNEYKKEKPLVILISGYPYFQPFYQPFIEYFKDDYSFFVFEAIHEYFNQKTRVTLSELLNFYKDIIGSVLKGKEIYAITGYCLGAEIALSLAQELKLQNKTTPKVLMLEGIFQRPKNQPIPEVENKLIYEHYRISTELTNSFPPLTFDGEMLICMAKKRSNRLSLEFTEEVTDPIILEAAREAFIANLSNWKREFPQSPYYEIDADHWSFFELEPLKELRAIIKKHWSNETHP